MCQNYQTTLMGRSKPPFADAFPIETYMNCIWFDDVPSHYKPPWIPPDDQHVCSAAGSNANPDRASCLTAKLVDVG